VARPNRDDSRSEHGGHHDCEPRCRRYEANFAGQGCASEDCASRRCPEYEKTTARKPATKSDKRPCSDADTCRDGYQMHDVDRKAHSGSLRRATDASTTFTQPHAARFCDLYHAMVFSIACSMTSGVTRLTFL
jgi:hypothetical protein